MCSDMACAPCARLPAGRDYSAHVFLPLHCCNCYRAHTNVINEKVMKML